jgi:predicted pyridoxine 5'-phosphate oxidase superfamily flavin-nucleotide-binding protein
MGSLYFDEHRRLQEEFDTVKLATLLDTKWVHDEIGQDEKAFIESRDFFFLSTVDPEGMPTVSYKGGPTGLVRVIDGSTLVFPGFDGNGMFYSVGNIEGQSKIGMLFIDFETPHRLRLQGTAKLLRDGPVLENWTEAKYALSVDVSKVWVNCPRYVHQYERVKQSKYVPDACKKTPLALWKRLDMVQDAIKPEERVAAENEGLLDLPAYEEKVSRGDA